ncbi:MAG: EAL domain-containing protein [Rhodospirillaceae bacterium]|nr:EAL domain-containing protein [Rhodospirillales bacterium]
MRIRAKFVLSHLLAALLPLAIMGGIAWTVVQKESRATVGNRLMEASSDATETLVHDFAAIATPLKAKARQMAGVMTTQDRDAQIPVLAELMTNRPAIAVVLLLGPEGQVVAGTRREIVGQNLSGHPAVRMARIGGFGRGPVEVQPYTGVAGFVLAAPVRDPASDRLLGMVMTVVNWAPFEGKLASVPVFGSGHDSGHRLLVTQKETGAVLYEEPSAGLPGPAISRLTGLEHNQQHIEVAAGERVFLASTNHTHETLGLPDPGWVVYALVDREIVHVGVNGMRELALLVALGAAGLTLLLGYVLAVHMVGPIQAVTGAFTRMASGDLTASLGIGQRDDEIGEMAKVLDIFRDNVIDMAKLSRAVEQSPASVIITDTTGAIEYVNARFCETTGYSAAEVIGQNPRLLKSGHTTDDQYRDMWQVLSTGREWRGEFSNKRKDGSLYWEYAWISAIRGADGAVASYLAVKEDITARKEYEEQLLRQANYDPLTNLPNRLLATDRLRQAIQRAQRHGGHAAAILVDIDRLRTLNDTLGHDAGDELLRQAAARLSNAMRAEDTVARLGGDEFLLVLTDIADPLDLHHITAKVGEIFAMPFLVADRDVVLGASMGVAIFPEDGDDPHVLVKNADAAMYLAKESGNNGLRFFTPELHQRASHRLAMESGLRTALAAGEFHMRYHPLVEAQSGLCTGAEALIRWDSPELGSVPPDLFIPIAEDTGLIVEIGEWVIRTVCADMARWTAMDLPTLRVAVNVSALQLADGRLAKVITESLNANNLNADRLEVELTERVLLDRDSDTLERLNELKALGIRLSIDDFGTGYSAMSYLTAFEFDVLKIDRSFVMDILTRRQDADLAQAMIAMAHALNLEVVAEGVELEGQVEFMRENGCEFLQGYYFCQPLRADDFAKLRRDWGKTTFGLVA